MSQIYFVSGNDIDGVSQDYFVAANSLQEAADIWALHMQKVYDTPDLTEAFHKDEIVQVRPAPTSASSMGVLEWPEVELEVGIAALSGASA